MIEDWNFEFWSYFYGVILGKGGMSSVMKWCFEVWLGIEQSG